MIRRVKMETKVLTGHLWGQLLRAGSLKASVDIVYQFLSIRMKPGDII